MSISSTKIKWSLIPLFFFFSSIFSIPAYAANIGLSSGTLKEYANNSIFFFNNCTIKNSSSNVSSICGDTAREKYWSLLRSILEVNDVAAAAMLGNSDHEGFLSPTQWQYNIVPQGTSRFEYSWDTLYNCPDNGCKGGIGAFQNTTWQGSFLRAVNDEDPDLLKYYQDASYSLPGDEALAKIGATDFDRLAELDVRALMKNRQDVVEHMRTIPDDESYLDEATEYFTKNYENCRCCGGKYAEVNNGGCSSELPERKKSAHDSYNLIKTFTCSSSSSSTSSSSDNDSDSEGEETINSDSDKPNTSSNSNGITWIGDSYSVAAKSKGLLPSDADVGSGTVDTASSYIQVSKFVSSDSSDNPSCLKILKKVIEAGSLRPNLVFACGTNGGWSDNDISTFEKLLKNQNVKAVVVNSKTPKDDYADSNERLKKLADENSNIALADWASVYKEEYFESDPGKIHPYTDPGFQKWTEVINDAMSGNSCTTYEGDYPSYPQCGSSWSNKYYGTNSDGKDYNMCDASCGASSMAMLATVAANQDIFPDNVADLLGNSYYWATSGSGMSALDKKVGDKYGFEVIDVPYDSLDDAEKKMKQYLDDGYMLHFSGKGSYPFSQGGHYIGVFGWSKDGGGDKVMLANSGGPGNAVASLHDVIRAGLHGGSFSAIKSSKNNKCSNDSDRICSPEDSDNGTSSGSCSAKVLNSVEKLISLAQKNGSEYPRGPDGKSTGGIRTPDGFDSILNNNASLLVDCTGFASLVMYDAFGVKQSFSTWDIASNANYVEIPKSEVQPGDIFSYNSGCSSPHGGIVVEMKNGKFTNIAQTGRSSYITKGFGGKNNNIGYSNYPNGIDGNLRCLNGDATDLKFYRYKGCN